MGDKLRKFKQNRQQEKHPFRPKKERPSLDLDDDMECDSIRFELPAPPEKEHENQEA